MSSPDASVKDDDESTNGLEINKSTKGLDDNSLSPPEVKDDESSESNESYESDAESGRAETEGVLFSKNDLENFDKYHRSSSTSRKGLIFGIAALVAIGMTSSVAFILGNKVRGDTNTAQTIAVSTALDNMSPDDILPANTGTLLALTSLAPLSEPFDYKQDVPFLWYIPAAANDQIRDTMRICLNYRFSKTYEGYETDAVFNFQFFPVLESFEGKSPPRRSRMFTMFREPMIRTVDMWYMHKAEEGDIPLEEWLEGHFDNNWMTRFLSRNFEYPLTTEDLEAAKDVIAERCIVGLDKFKEDSFKRFVSYFKWDTLNLDTQRCVNSVLNDSRYEDNVKYPEEFSHDYELLMNRNHMDIQLYEFAEKTYTRQKREYFPRLNM